MGYKIVRCNRINIATEQNPAASLPIDEFEKYKTIAMEYGDIPSPSEVIQREHPAHLETIGRDRPMTHPIEARAEELHHVHIWQEGCCWEDDEGLKVQWASTSDSYVVYSYFIDRDDDHHFYVIDYCIDGAHGLIENRSQVLDWANQAERYRLRNI
ncbi:type II toxin-antitoxin system YafO family toxin [Serratia sp. IR-2025]|nr:type II toxin-antitoxin system YafO family toxin [Serratia marcescens]MBN5346994.1 type II toxin-antitoxin system YafO family toxin [Serratia marcescens]